MDEGRPPKEEKSENYGLIGLAKVNKYNIVKTALLHQKGYEGLYKELRKGHQTKEALVQKKPFYKRSLATWTKLGKNASFFVIFGHICERAIFCTI